MAKSQAARVDLHQSVTDEIVRLLEQGVRPWSQSWNGGAINLRPLRATGEAYRGINVLALLMSAHAHGYTSRYWMGFDRALKLGGAVRKGQRSTRIAFYTRFVAGAGSDSERTISVLRSYSVFNADQIDGLPPQYYAASEPADTAVTQNQRLAHAEAFFAGLGADIQHGGSRAYYSPASDEIRLPAFEAFHSADGYYVTLGHECVHWTAHRSRLNRTFSSERWGDAGYALEELVAELGAAFLGADLGLTTQTRESHASYIDSWIAVLKQDKRAIFRAASQAEKAVAFLSGCGKTPAVPGDTAPGTDGDESGETDSAGIDSAHGSS